LARGKPTIERMLKAGVSRDAAERHVLTAADNGRLPLDEVYVFDDGRQVTGWEIVADVKTFDGCTGADPLEPTYGGGRNKAKWYRKGGERGSFVFSFAHGRRLYRLAYDAADLIALASRLTGDIPDQISALRDAYYLHYVPEDAKAAAALLRQAGFPRPGVLAFDDPEPLSRRALLDVLAAQDWRMLARLRQQFGRLLLNQALGVLRLDDLFARVDSFDIDWDTLEARIDAAAKLLTRAAPIEIKPGDMHTAADAAELALAKALPWRPVLQRSGGLVRPRLLPAKSADGRDIEAIGLLVLSPVMLADDLAHSVQFERYNASKKKWLPIDPPALLTVMVLSRSGLWPDIPVIKGVVSAPTLRPDGSLLHRSGYDPATRLYHAPARDLVLAPVLLGAPTRDDALAAAKLLTDLLSEVAFADEVSRAAGLSLLITPAVRGALRFAPMHLIRAPVAGSGKTWLADIAYTILAGTDCPAITTGKSDAEFEKRLDGMLLRAHQIILVDNATADLEGEKLCVAITGSVIGVRALGGSNIFEIENTACIIATGNNVRAVGDATRRTITINLDPKREQPEERQFKQNPKAMVLADRGKYLSACLTIVRAYLLAGQPRRLTPLAGFEDWSNLVRSALIWLGFEDPAKSIAAGHLEDPGKQALRRCVNAWHDVVGVGKRLLAKELVALADEFVDQGEDKGKTRRHPELHDAMAEAVGTAVTAGSLGNWLRRNKDKVVGKLQITAPERTRNDQQLWGLTEVSP
jgi:putative DNA primase/helicase